MNKTKLTISILCFSLLSIVSCKKEGCTDADATNYDEKAKEDDGSCTYEFSTPATYDFYDAAGNSTVSYTGQTDRMNMLGELINHMKTENGDEAGANTLDENAMHNMYANQNSPFAGAGVGASGKDLESKTAGSEAIQTQFKTWMSEAAAASTQATTGYFQNADGLEWTQLVEKGLMTACFAYQITDNYLTDNKIGATVDNLTPEDGDLYTDMEHHWDEGYGYFADNNNYDSSSNRYWVKYGNKSYMNGLGAEIAEAFRTGRAAINASRLAGGDGLRFHADVLAQRDIVVAKVYRMAAGMAIHYLYDTKNSVASQESQNDINHSLSEAYAFIYGLKVLNGGTWNSMADGILATIGAGPVAYSANSDQIMADIQTIATAAGISDPESFE
tara:strand:- start:17293 stop:18456 length:1164 start_codon:yes stop_codon:yes gene_type:complete